MKHLENSRLNKIQNARAPGTGPAQLNEDLGKKIDAKNGRLVN